MEQRFFHPSHERRLLAMREIVTIGLILMTIGLGGCGGKAPTGEGPLTIVVSILPLKSLVEAVAGEEAEVIVLVPPSATPHTFEPKPSDVRALTEAQLLVLVGLGLEEPWAYKMTESAGNPKLKIVELAKGIDPIGGLEHPNPHIWLSPKNALQMLENLKRALIEIDPEGREEYEQRAQAYEEKLRRLDQAYRLVLERLPDRRFVATRPTFAYLARDYGLEQVAVVAGVPGQEPSPQRIAEMIKLIREERIPVLIALAQAPDPFAETIAQETGVRLVRLDPMGLNNSDYIKLMQGNLEALARAFRAEGQGQRE